MPTPADTLELLQQAFHRDDAGTFRSLLSSRPDLKARINDPVAAFDSPLINCVRSRAMLDVLLDAGADINARSLWWAGGFGLLDTAAPELADYAIQRGATVNIHAAARLGLMPRLRELVAEDPSLVHARGGDGQTPLHFATTIEVADLLLDHGADIDARDIDHESTAAQYMVRDRQDIARHLVRRGCRTDLLMAAALGDASLVRRHLADDPDSIRIRVNDDHFPMSNPRAGGTIYQWTLGWHVSPHDVAREFGHADIHRLLLENSPADVRLLTACWEGDAPTVANLLEAKPDLVSRLTPADRRLVADAARNNNTAAVRLMLDAGLPVDALGQHRATPLHWAAWHGNLEMVREVLRRNPPLEATDADFHATPVGWAIHGSEHGWHCRTGDYAGTVEALLDAGATFPKDRAGCGSEPVKAVLRRRGLEP